MSELQLHDPAEPLFRWSDGRVVLFVEHDGDYWSVSRGWLATDRMEDVRRWRYESDRRLIGQIRRLVREVTGESAELEATVESFTRWLIAQQAQPGPQP